MSSAKHNLRKRAWRTGGVAATLLITLGLVASTASAQSTAPEPTQEVVATATSSTTEVVQTAAAPATVTVPSAISAPSTVAAPIGPLHGARYYYQTICIQKGTEFWPTANAAQFFENSGAIDFSQVTTNCGSTLPYQRMLVDDYAAADNTCAQTSAFPVQHAGQNYYTWSSTPTPPTLKLNAYYATCYNTATRKAHVVSRGIGYLLGLAAFNDPTPQYLSVMNDTPDSVSSVAWAQALDRNGVYCRYLGCGSVPSATDVPVSYRMMVDGSEYVLMKSGVTKLIKQKDPALR